CAGVARVGASPRARNRAERRSAANAGRVALPAVPVRAHLLAVARSALAAVGASLARAPQGVGGGIRRGLVAVVPLRVRGVAGPRRAGGHRKQDRRKNTSLSPPGAPTARH